MRALGLWSCLVVAACGPVATEVRPADASEGEVERLFPSAPGTAWSYDVVAGEGPPALVVAKVVAREGDLVAIAVSGSEPNQFELRDDGVYSLETGTYALKWPLVEGHTWPSRGGGEARVVRTDAVEETSAGRFEGCVVVRETRVEPPATVETSYCPGVGVTRLEVSRELDEGELRSTSSLRGFARGAR